jgi:hypothetical protein
MVAGSIVAGVLTWTCDPVGTVIGVVLDCGVIEELVDLAVELAALGVEVLLVGLVELGVGLGVGEPLLLGAEAA